MHFLPAVHVAHLLPYCFMQVVHVGVLHFLALNAGTVPRSFAAVNTVCRLLCVRARSAYSVCDWMGRLFWRA